jgi:uncharacterized protein
MQLENSFALDVSPEVAWEALLDVPRIVPCIPGAELVEERSSDEWLVRVKVKLGSMGMDFMNDVKMERRDDDARTVELVVRGRDVAGRGMVNAAVSSKVDEASGQTRVTMTTNLQIAGKMAQFGRGIVGDVSESLVDSFAEALRAELSRPAVDSGPGPPPRNAGQASPADAPPRTPKSLSASRLLLAVVRRRLGRLFGRRKATQS